MNTQKTHNFITFLDDIEATKFDIMEALYRFCSDYHEGQFSDKYRIMCETQFSPGPLSRGPEEVAGLIYSDLLDTNIVSVEELFNYASTLENE